MPNAKPRTSRLSRLKHVGKILVIAALVLVCYLWIMLLVSVAVSQVPVPLWLQVVIWFVIMACLTYTIVKFYRRARGKSSASWQQNHDQTTK